MPNFTARPELYTGALHSTVTSNQNIALMQVKMSGQIELAIHTGGCGFRKILHQLSHSQVSEITQSWITYMITAIDTSYMAYLWNFIIIVEICGFC